MNQANINNKLLKHEVGSRELTVKLLVLVAHPEVSSLVPRTHIE